MNNSACFLLTEPRAGYDNTWTMVRQSFTVSVQMTVGKRRGSQVFPSAPTELINLYQ